MKEKFFKRLWRSVRDCAGKVWEWVADLAGRIWDKILEDLRNSYDATRLFSWLFLRLSGAVEWAIGKLQGLHKWAEHKTEEWGKLKGAALAEKKKRERDDLIARKKMLKAEQDRIDAALKND